VTPHWNGFGNFWNDFLQNHQMRGRTDCHSPESRARAAQRMRENNPMFDPEIAQRANTKRMLAELPSKVELRFSRWTKEHQLPISFRGNGLLWINRRNPDFRVLEQKKVIEITTSAVYDGMEKVDRTAANYGLNTVAHYTKSQWQCLVIFCPADHRHRLPATLLPVVINYCLRESNWSGIWDYSELIRFD
jgi:hypothetical protein